MAKRYTYVRTPDPVYVTTEKEADLWVDRYLDVPAIGFDTETTGLDKLDDRIKFFSFSDGGSRICAPVRLLENFVPVLEDGAITKRMTNAKFDMHMAASHGIVIQGVIHDTLVLDWLLDENRPKHGLKSCTKDYLGLRMAPFKEVFGAIGSVNKEVEMVTTFHDILEAMDSDAAADVLIAVGKADGDDEVISALKKLSLSKQGNYSLDAKKILTIARKHGLAEKSGGKWSYVADFLNMVSDIHLPKQADRAPYVHLAEDHVLIEEAHELLLRQLRKEVKIDREPLDLLELLVNDYASLDAWGSFTLVDVLKEKLEDIYIDDDYSTTLWDYFEETAAPFTRVLWNMERRGLKIDLPVIEKYRKPMEKEVGQIERKFVKLAGRDINLKSPPQMRELFYKKDNNGDWVDPFGNPPMKWTKGGASGQKMPSTDKEVIEHWADRGDKMAGILQDHRKFSKLHDTYLVGVPAWVDHRDRIHTSLKQIGTVTGRLSSGDPNLQNIPSRGIWGERIRQAFIAGFYGDCSPTWCVEELADIEMPDLPRETEMTLIVADYDQLEMRIMAHFSEDPVMIDAIHRGLDLHCRTAELAGGLDYDDLVKAKKAENPTPAQKALIEERSGYKAVGFGLIYGIGAVKLGRQLGYPIDTRVSRRSGRPFELCPKATETIEKYFDVFPDVAGFIDDTKEACREDLFVQTIAGRFRRLPDIISNDRGSAAYAERQSVNSIIQGSAADITIQAMLNCEFDPVLRKLGVRMLLQIHDELVFECPKIPWFVQQAQKRIRELMENPFDMLVPITVSMGTSDNWGEGKS